MIANILSPDDLLEFKIELLIEIEKLLHTSQKNTKVEKRFLKSSDVQELLGICDDTLYNLRVNCHLPHAKIGGTYIMTGRIYYR